MSSIKTQTVSLLLLSLLLAPRARAQDVSLAKQHYTLGAELYKRADFKGALDQFRKSYDLSKKRPLFYNIARCQESLGMYDEAIKSYQEYLQDNPKDADVVRARMANIQKLASRMKARQKPAAPPRACIPALRPPRAGDPARDRIQTGRAPRSPS